MQTLHPHIEQLIQLFGQSIGEPVELSIISDGERHQKVVFEVAPGAEKHFIGKQGVVLEALQHIVNTLEKKEGVEMHTRIDVGGYQAEKKQHFLEQVKKAVEEALDPTDILLWPMSAYERRQVHEFFLERGDYETGSENFGTQRVVRLTKKG